MVDVQRLRALLAAATPGDWRVALDDEGRIEPHIKAGDWFVATVIDGADSQPPDANAALIAAMHEALPELLAIAEASEWQPIDSAPKDGTLVIVGAAGHESVSARWGWEAPWIDGWWCDGHRSDAEGPNFTPTHWRPLPKAPTRQSAGDGV